ncbi:MAG TPA: hypothetical protein VLA88_06370 [Candidatus Saccharimonadales bacterium]|nr:hypothetical protein [Candidatus Saccharimonadales bacterium]
MVTKVLYCLMSVAFIALIVALVTPNTFVAGLSVRFYTVMAISLFGLQVCTVAFFLSSLRNYQPRLRWAYIVLSAGILLLGVAQLQMPVIAGFRLLDSWWISSGLILVPFALSAVAIYGGAYILARTVGWRSIIAKPFIVTLGIFVACAASFALPHVRITGNTQAELQFDAFVALTVWTMLFNAIGGALCWVAARRIGALYVVPMKWLSIALVAGSLASFAELLYSLLTPESLTWYTRYALNLLPVVGAGVLLLAAGVLFKEVSKRRLAASANPADVIVYMAQLVSKPRAIDNLLDTLRTITAGAPQGQLQLTMADKQTIVSLYLLLEEYIIQKESVRKFNKDELRMLLPDSFVSLLTSYEMKGKAGNS